MSDSNVTDRGITVDNQHEIALVNAHAASVPRCCGRPMTIARAHENLTRYRCLLCGGEQTRGGRE